MGTVITEDKYRVAIQKDMFWEYTSRLKSYRQIYWIPIAIIIIFNTDFSRLKDDNGHLRKRHSRMLLFKDSFQHLFMYRLNVVQ